MTVRTIKTTKGEAEEILANRLRHIYRSDKQVFRNGDVIEFLVIHNHKPVAHKIDDKAYVVTSVEDCMTAPVLKGWQLIGFRSM